MPKEVLACEICGQPKRIADFLAPFCMASVTLSIILKRGLVTLPYNTILVNNKGMYVIHKSNEQSIETDFRSCLKPYLVNLTTGNCGLPKSTNQFDYGKTVLFTLHKSVCFRNVCEDWKMLIIVNKCRRQVCI